MQAAAPLQQAQHRGFNSAQEEEFLKKMKKMMMMLGFQTLSTSTSLPRANLRSLRRMREGGMPTFCLRRHWQEGKPPYR
ncbi:hypothetical protein ABID21_000871 [Pseudorhizobium tarimense]|uniref:Uncharacterized protein n=1 Tax=Pseudorhizobium tarimense TaxID=1079109 RepID=A0ABV2H2L3_9HYPH|nr:hypothetical protein [Pseudorhizobium tarimense]MCJ8518231.1 hypothetical protein [Pseudorhizobium tarimense]